MENKNKYYKAFIDNNGQQNEIDLGIKIGLNENETREIIVQLMTEHKIEYVTYRACDYRLLKTNKQH